MSTPLAIYSSANRQSHITQTGTATDHVRFPNASRADGVTVQYEVRTTDGEFVLLADIDGSSYAYAANGTQSTSVNAGAGSPQLFVDGIAQNPTTRLQVRNLISTGQWLTVRIENLDAASWSQVVTTFATSAGFNFAADIRNFKADVTGNGVWDFESSLGNSGGFVRVQP